MAYVDQLKATFEHLTHAQKDLARFVLDRSDEVAFMSARQLADAVGQSDAAVVRFARAVGYDGFPHLKAALREGILERTGASGMRSQSLLPQSELELFDQLFEIEASLVTATAKMNSAETAASVVDRLIAARRIWVTGHGTTYSMASYIAMHLNQVLGNVAMFNIDHGDLAARFREVSPADVFLGVGYVRYIPYTIEILRVAKGLGAQIVAITDSHTSPLAQLADDALYAARGTASFAWWSQAGTLAIADWLTSLIMVRDADNVNERLRQADAVWKQLGHLDTVGNAKDDPGLQQQMAASRKRKAVPPKAAQPHATDK
ncbi:MurR/RpiR family transcriptional regulator [Paraburkholderia tropica]|uniref:MurR/RpiR family transcriptional regulator n=1 Tax=Paraburkholderia tropica TaxID=92647 RepID=UPI002AB61B0A|nr:MurR/RpiR family transcriptional regulator [Paraburkholderia tropica]